MIPTLPNGEPQKGPTPAARADARHQPRMPSPRESLGRSARSGLFKASVQAGIGFVVVFAGMTFGPYFWEKSQAGAKATGPAPAEKTGTPAAGQPAAVAPTPDASGKPPAGAAAGGKVPGKGDIVDKLGENGTKAAPAKVNPLDKKDDDILKDIK